MGVNLSAKFRKDDSIFDGLKNIEKVLAEEPLRRYLVVAVVQPKFSKINHEDGTVTVTVKTTAIEPLSGDAAEAAKKLLAEAFSDRTGRDDDPFAETLFDGDITESAEG